MPREDIRTWCLLVCFFCHRSSSGSFKEAMRKHCSIIVAKTLVCDVMPCNLFPLFPSCLYPASSWMPWTDPCLNSYRMKDKPDSSNLYCIWEEYYFQLIFNLQLTDKNLLGISHSQRPLAFLHTQAWTNSNTPKHNKHMHTTHMHTTHTLSVAHS